MLTEKKTPYVTGEEIVKEIKEGMKECKLSPKEPYSFEFHLYFKKAKDAKAAEVEVKALGMQTEVIALDKNHACVGTVSMKVDYPQFAKWGKACVAIAGKHHGDFDGWQMGPPQGENLVDEEGNLDISALLGGACMVIGNQRAENPHDHEVNITIPGNIDPVDRGELYEDPLIAALKKKKKLGVVFASHSELETSKNGARIKAAVIRCGTAQPKELITFLKQWTKEKKFPKGTRIATAN